MQLFSLCCLVLLLSACSSRQSPAPVTTLNDIRNYYKKYPQGQPGSVHTVQPGDTLYSIAFRAGMDYRQLAKLNNIAPPYRILVGQKIHFFNVSLSYPAAERPVSAVKSQKSTTSTVKAAKQNQSKLTTANKAVARNNQTGYVQKQTVKENATSATNSVSSSKVRWAWPVRGPILAGFSKAEHGNKGLDIGGKSGTPIKAAAAGEVVYAGNALRGYGNLVIIRHNDDFLSAYAHNRKLLVKERDTVVSGQTIAEMGNTDAPSVRLHFEIRFRGKSVDPKRYLK
ncbi:MAG: peptidoglycan DD-metalloendopeptidase family protein [Gammaproteobacteria bacterium]|nr:peptidoglycan DD-metalloendopeptidase family protein [Gammaproteobacteria bacterium]MBU2059806.1 peptidoglycan DD-metalloendopeptidase family protein [Gammaproteobacteria bacterium]MBU2175414.1 peptidoglycan DD-metalloendopeptidase family protein [Gammaproteobacteria bacterium]MBU2245678.1 peptidoglycan DD-metalloendopeptidase family protein [Gammaproteobacteria bacterium]MBU2343133.1 peptidoglycan DD-metalloendopeptidase family protein [Gammaproteobacteria bacterium]